MIVACPKCGKRYQVPDEKIGDAPRRLRCRNCSEIFTVAPSSTPPPQKPSSEPVEESSTARARRLARVLASDMVVYNKETVDKARREGNLAEVMCAEIDRSWQLWKSRFPEEAVNRSDLFRDALREILAAGSDDFDGWEP
ncbi:hypothetical protein GX411_02550 [Candidatus Fermentibacteria bacterium]|nr:hypothetical protein [Candidatus Fermentibacteria bacterium]